MINKSALFRSAFSVSVFSTLTLLLTFITQLILAEKFGSSIKMDAYFTAIAVPMVLVRILVLPLNSVFVPLFKDTEAESGVNASARFAATIFWTFLVIFVLLGATIIVFAHPIARLIIPGSGPSTIRVTVRILRVIGVYLFFNGMFFTTQSLHLAKNSFGVPYFGNTLASLITLLATFALIGSQGVLSIVYGGTLGFAVAFGLNVLLLPQRLTVRPALSRPLGRQFLTLFLPLSLGSLVYRSTPIIDRYFASFLPEGEIAFLGYGARVLEGLVTLLSTGLAVVLLPLTSGLSARKDRQNLTLVLAWGLRMIGLAVVPVAGYLFFFSQDLVRIIFERGKFTPADTQKVATVLAAYAGALLALSLGGQLANVLYAQKRHRQVVAVNLILMPVYVGLVFGLSRSLGVAGIGLAFSLLTLTTVLVYSLLIGRYLTMAWATVGLSFTRFLLASALMIVVLKLLGPFFKDGGPFFLLAQIALGGLSYFLALLFLQSPEIYFWLKRSR